MNHKSKQIYYLGIGSNINRRENLKSCLQHFRCAFAHCKTSPVYRSASYGFNGQDFFNLVVQIQSTFMPQDLKVWVQTIEDLHGRDRSKPRYSNRTLDIDLLLCNDWVFNDDFVQIPRPEILKRKYVLKPLQDLAPNLIHPVAQKRLADLWQALAVSDHSRLEQVDEIFTFQ